MPLPISLQLYTVRDPMAQDFEGTLRAVAAAGYRHVEFAGLYDLPAREVRGMLDRLGLRASSGHAGIDNLPQNMERQIEDAQTLGFRHIVCPYLAGEYRTPEGYRRAARLLNQAGRLAADAGLQMCYHNHSFEFDKLDDGSTGMDILYGELDPDLVHAELDVYWVRHGHQDPLAWMRRLSGRVPLLHIKDMDDTPDRGFIEVGTGIIDMEAVVQTAGECGVEFLVIEQDAGWKGGPLESARTSLENFRLVVEGTEDAGDDEGPDAADALGRSTPRTTLHEEESDADNAGGSGMRRASTRPKSGGPRSPKSAGKTVKKTAKRSAAPRPAKKAKAAQAKAAKAPAKKVAKKPAAKKQARKPAKPSLSAAKKAATTKSTGKTSKKTRRR